MTFNKERYLCVLDKASYDDNDVFKEHKINIITYIEDVLFWILTGLLILYNIWYFNNGEIRIYMFLGIIMGVLIYMSTLSNILIKTFSTILQTIIKVLKVPIKAILTFSKKRCIIMVNPFQKGAFP